MKTELIKEIDCASTKKEIYKQVVVNGSYKQTGNKT